MSEQRRICVYCGSSPGRRPDYIDAARSLGRTLVDRDYGLVYGGAKVGLMGGVANAVLEAGGEVHGIIPESLVDKELAHDGLTELHIVPSMHARKMLMADLSDGFIALPGGIGTLEEIFEIWTWAQLGYHAKPYAFLNAAGYYDRLIAFLDHQSNEGFVRKELRDDLIIEAEPGRILDAFENYQPVTVEKWVDRSEL